MAQPGPQANQPRAPRHGGQGLSDTGQAAGPHSGPHAPEVSVICGQPPPENTTRKTAEISDGSFESRRCCSESRDENSRVSPDLCGVSGPRRAHLCGVTRGATRGAVSPSQCLRSSPTPFPRPRPEAREQRDRTAAAPQRRDGASPKCQGACREYDGPRERPGPHLHNLYYGVLLFYYCCQPLTGPGS